VATHPHEALVVDMNAVLAVEPLVLIGGAGSPGIDHFSFRIEGQHRRGGRTAGCLQHCMPPALVADTLQWGGARIGCLHCPGAMNDPDIVICINGGACYLADYPIIWQ